MQFARIGIDSKREITPFLAFSCTMIKFKMIRKNKNKQ